MTFRILAVVIFYRDFGHLARLVPLLVCNCPLLLDSSTCTCSYSRFHDAVRDLHLNARTRTLRATTLSRRRLLGAIDRVDDDA
jgi:hypothetical protein